MWGQIDEGSFMERTLTSSYVNEAIVKVIDYGSMKGTQ